MQRRRFLFLASFAPLFMLADTPLPVWAQGQSSSEPSASPARRALIEVIHYDPKQQGPLLWIAPAELATFDPKEEQETRTTFGKATAQQFADRLQLRLIRSGNVSALVPVTMQVMPENFGTPDPYAGMRRSERIRILISLFSREQWQIVGSERGIGMENLTEEQRPLLVNLFSSDPAVIQHTRIEPAPDGRGEIYASIEEKKRILPGRDCDYPGALAFFFV